MAATSPRVVLAIDLGTTWCKTSYIDAEGTVLAQGRAFSRFGTGYGVDTDDLVQIWVAVVAAVRQTAAAFAGVAPPSAIGVSCRGGNGVWLDRDGVVLGVPGGVPRPTEREIAEVYTAPEWGDVDPFACAYAPTVIARTRWLRRAFPSLWARVGQVVALHDWIVHRLCGVWATDPATGSGYLDLPAEAAALCGLPLTAFPPTSDFAEPVGGLTTDAARDLGLPPGTAVVSGCHDGVAANLGAGAIWPGDACITLGSSLVLRVVSARSLPGVFGYPISRDRWAWVRGIHGTARQLDSVVTAIDDQPAPVAPDRHQTCAALAWEKPIGAGGLRLPVLPAGEEDRQRELAQRALSRGLTKGAVYRAAIEGVASAIRDLADVAHEDGALPRRFVVTGGMNANSLLLNILSGVLRAVLEIADPEAGVRGAAILAACGAGWYPSLEDAVRNMTRPGEMMAANPETIAAYAEWLPGQPHAQGTAPRRRAWRWDQASTGVGADAGGGRK